MTAYKFCGHEDVIKFTRIGQGFTGHDSLINDQIIPAATALVQSYCRRKFIREAIVEYHPTIKRCAPANIWLRENNVQSSPTPVVKLYYGFPASWADIAALDSEYYEFDYEQGMVTLLLDTEEHRRSIQVSYTAGYAVDSGDNVTVDVPDAIKSATAMHSAFMLERIVNREIGQKDKKGTSGAVNPRLADEAIHGLIPAARALLNPYRRLLIGGI